jgi:hypothetical protein
MPFTPGFSTSQTTGIPNSINFTDTSTGLDTNIVSRRVFMQTATNDYLVEPTTTTNYEEWAIISAPLDPLSISFDVLKKDMALYLTVQWLDAADTVLYQKQYLTGFTLYNESFDYQLTQVLSGNPLVINDHNFFPNKSTLRVSIDSGNQAIFLAADIFAAQQCYDRATNLRLNSPYFFNANV